MGAILLASQTRQMAPDCTKNTALVEYDRATETAEKCGGNGTACNFLHRNASNCPAEREGFEPSVQLPAHRFSRPDHNRHNLQSHLQIGARHPLVVPTVVPSSLQHSSNEHFPRSRSRPGRG
jgi:hypothetical protein